MLCYVIHTPWICYVIQLCLHTVDMFGYVLWDLHNVTTWICCVIVMFYLGLWTPADLIWIKWLFDAHSIETEIEFQTLLLATQDFREFLSVANLWTENCEFTRSGLKSLIKY